MAQQEQTVRRDTHLTVAEYDQAESDAVLNVPNTAVEAFQYALGNQKGYPTRIQNESELWKYVDVNAELAFENTFQNLLGGITEEEFDQLKRLTTQVSEFSEQRFGRKMLARGTVVSGLNILRHIKYIFGDDHPRVFEIGPGAGSLGSLLLSEGFPYASTDVSQGFYIYQNQIWDHVSGGKVRDLAKPSTASEGWAAPSPGSAVHGPWWEFIKIRHQEVPQYDVVTCNEVLREMHLTCLSLTLKTAQRFLEDQYSTKKLFMFRGWGGGFQTSDGVVAEHFYRLGYVLIHHDQWISVLAPRDTPWAAGHLALPSQTGGIKSKTKQLMRRMAGAAGLPPSTFYQPRLHSSPENPISQAITQGRQAQSESKTVKMEEVVQFYTELVGTDDHLNPDEHFLLDCIVERPGTAKTVLQ